MYHFLNIIDLTWKALLYYLPLGYKTVLINLSEHELFHVYTRITPDSCKTCEIVEKCKKIEIEFLYKYTLLFKDVSCHLSQILGK